MIKPIFYSRPIAYRAWAHNKMVQVQTLCWSPGGIIWYAAGNQFGWGWINPDFNGWTQDQPRPDDGSLCPIMAWTGLISKDGVPIYEGDVMASKGNFVSDHSDEDGNFPNFVGIVKWDLKDFSWGVEVVSPSHLNEVKGRNGPWSIGPFLSGGEVLGDIYQNPELLKP